MREHYRIGTVRSFDRSRNHTAFGIEVDHVFTATGPLFSHSKREQRAAKKFAKSDLELVAREVALGERYQQRVEESDRRIVHYTRTHGVDDKRHKGELKRDVLTQVVILKRQGRLRPVKHLWQEAPYLYRDIK